MNVIILSGEQNNGSLLYAPTYHNNVFFVLFNCNNFGKDQENFNICDSLLEIDMMVSLPGWIH